MFTRYDSLISNPPELITWKYIIAKKMDVGKPVDIPSYTINKAAELQTQDSDMFDLPDSYMLFKVN